MAFAPESDRIREKLVASIARVRRKLALRGRLGRLGGRFPQVLWDFRVPLAATLAAVVAVAGTFMAAEQYVSAQTRTYYKVLIDGQFVGEISSQELVADLIEDTRKRLEQNNLHTKVRYVLREPEVTFQVEKAYKAEPDDEGTLQRVAASLETYPVGVKLVIDGKLVGVVRDEATARVLLERVKDRYAGGLEPAGGPEVTTLSFKADGGNDSPVGEEEPSPDRQILSVGFVETISVVPAEISPDDVQDPEELYEKLVTGNPTPVKYTVQQGDCISCIAQKLNVSKDLIYRNNPWIENDLIRVGDVLDLTQERPLLNVETEELVTQTETIKPQVIYQDNNQMNKGQTKVVSQGKPGQQLVTYRVIKLNGEPVEQEQLNVQVLVPAEPKIIMRGTKIVRGLGSGKFAMPVVNYRITSKYGQRWGRQHKGIDIIGNKNIMAADSGVVEFAGKKNGLGNAIIIDHKNGFKTVYGHLSKISVKKGQAVEKGDVIGIMGNTGNSTGVHLHFEIHKNGKVKNPLDYL
jgi:murein DD-endopeptidase MepM/ murein hydrolase activator NlpD